MFDKVLRIAVCLTAIVLVQHQQTEATESLANISFVCPASENIDCRVPENGSNANLIYTYTDCGSLANYSCINGYIINSGNETRRCEQNWTWSGSALVCIYECGAPDAPANGNVSFDKTATGEQANYSCDDNYTLFGNVTRVCVDGQGWNGTVPTCLKDCGTLESGSYSDVTSTLGLKPGSVAEYTCFSNYTRLSGNEQRYCIENGMWNGTALSCIYECGAPEPPADGNVRFDKTVTGEQANYLCADNYTLFGNETRVCIDGQGWNGSAPSCLKACASLSLKNGNVALVGSGSAGTVAVFTCNEGFSLIGPKLLTCLQDTVWSDYQPECKITDTSSTSADITIALSVTIPIILILLTVVIVLILYYRGTFNKGNITTDERGTPCGIGKLNVHLAEINLSSLNSSRAYQNVEDRNNGATYNAKDESCHYYEGLTEECADQPYEELGNEGWKSQAVAAL